MEECQIPRLTSFAFDVDKRPFFSCGAVARSAEEVVRPRDRQSESWEKLLRTTTEATRSAVLGEGASDRRMGHRIVLFHNTTSALQRILWRLDRELRDCKATLLTTDLEFPGCLTAIDDAWSGDVVVARIARAVESSEVESHSNRYRRALERAATFARPRVFVLSHVTRATGVVLPEKALQFIRAWNPRSIIIVDGTQAVGNIVVSRDMLSLCDFYVTGGHKWLGGLPTTGIVLESHDGEWDVSDPSQSISKPGMHGGTGSALALKSLRASIDDLLLSNPAKRVRDIDTHNRDLATLFRRLVRTELSRMGIAVASSPFEERAASGIVALRVKKGVAEKLRDAIPSCEDLFTSIADGSGALDRLALRNGRRLRVVELLEDAPPLLSDGDDVESWYSGSDQETLRFCFHYYHGSADVERLVATLSEAGA